MREELRRRRRNQEAWQMSSAPADPSDEMEAVLPFLDDALAQLRTTDRDALSLRYLEGKTFAEVARALAASEEATRKRVQRALERLRGLLGRRGVTMGTAALATGLGAFSTQAAPAGLAAAISSAAVQQAAGVAAVSLLTHTTIQIMKVIQWKTAAVAVGAVAIASTAGIVLTQQHAQPAAQVAGEATRELERKVARLEADNRRLTESLADAQRALASSNQKRQAAESEAFSYKQLAEKIHAENLSPAEAYPTQRHVWAGMGKTLKMAVDATTLPSKLKSMPPEERQARSAELLKQSQEAVRVSQAASQLNIKDPATPEEYADMVSCFLYGAVDLNEEQFSQVASVLQSYYRQNGASVSAQDVMMAGASPGKTASGKTWADLDEQSTGAIKGFLPPAQQETFAALLKFDRAAMMRQVMSRLQGP